jgi:hypothetical protein
MLLEQSGQYSPSGLLEVARVSIGYLCRHTVINLLSTSCTLPFCDHRADFLIVGSDSGRIVVLEYETKTNQWKKLHEETYGKSGSRRIVPGQHLAVDPKGRSAMIGALEKSKLYVLRS